MKFSEDTLPRINLVITFLIGRADIAMNRFFMQHVTSIGAYDARQPGIQTDIKFRQNLYTVMLDSLYSTTRRDLLKCSTKV